MLFCFAMLRESLREKFYKIFFKIFQNFLSDL